MYKRRSSAFAAAMALTTLVSRPTAAEAQSPVPITAAPASLALGALASSPAPVTLKSTYRIRLVSAWPQWGTRSSGCVNGGEETIAGTLTANDAGSFGGTFTRHTRLLFCGAHGSAVADRCELTLEGEGAVTVSATIVADESSPSGRGARLLWMPAPGHRATVTGTCSESFKRAVEAMYLKVHHSVEVPLIGAGSAPINRQLQDYPWTVDVE